MTLLLYAENNDGDIVLVSDKLRADVLEVAQSAAEGSVSSSTIVLDDPDAEFYIRGLKPLYLVETDAEDDDWFGIIGVFFSFERTFRRGDHHRTEAGREVHIVVQDVNTLLSRRLQKGADAKRPQENDTTRIAWLLTTPELAGGYDVANTDYVFSDSPVPMSETDYTSQDSSGVLNDALQDGGKNGFLFPSPTADDPLRLGMWYGRTERTDYASPHRISNFLADISPETLDPQWLFDPDYVSDLTFAPSIDASLSRDPGRVASGVIVMADGSYAYATNPSTAEAFAPRDMVMQAELVKTQAQAARRAARYVRDLRNEDDAIECAVIVPNALVNAYVQGQRVQVRFSYLPGYAADFVWMRVASRTVRQLSSGSGLYEIALDLRAEEPPDSGTTGNGLAACPVDALTPAGTFYPLGGTGNTPGTDPDGVIYYLKPGPVWPQEPVANYAFNGWHFPEYEGGGAGTADYAGDCAENRLRIMVVGDGTVSVGTEVYGPARDMAALLFHSDTDPPESVTLFTLGDTVEVTVSTHSGEHCVHWVDIRDYSNPPECGSKWGWSSATWTPT